MQYFIIILVLIYAVGCTNSSDFYPSDYGNQLDTIPPRGARVTDANRWRVWLQPDGRWGYDPKDSDNDGYHSGGEFPKWTKHYSMYAGGLYVGTLKNGMPTVSEIEFLSEFLPGRILNADPASVDQLSASNPDSAAIYILTEPYANIDWNFWPSQWGAPVDENGRPLQISKQDSWAVFHDLSADTLNPHEPGVNRSLGLEIQRMTYMFEFLTLSDAFFVRFRITNKSTNTYPGTYIALWCDKDLGDDVSDDRFGSDFERQMMFVYNSGNGYPSSTGREYAIGYKILYITGQISPELSSTNYYSNGADPRNDYERHNLLKGLMQNGESRLFGFDPQYPMFVYPGDPVTNSGIIDSTYSHGRILLNVGPFTMESGQSYDFVCAVIGGEADSPMNAVMDLRKKADQIQNFFNQLMAPAMQLK